jgi:hypothetical protein
MHRLRCVVANTKASVQRNLDAIAKPRERQCGFIKESKRERKSTTQQD